jgi:predicted phage terminase large subunit-like protein
MANLTPQEAARELLRRRLARKSLIGFANSIDIPGAPVSDDPEEWMFRPVETSVAKHHEIIMSTLDEVANGTLKRVMLFLPPGSAKSTYASVVFPSYYLGKIPNSKIIAASYGSDLAKRMGRKARQIIRSKAYGPVFNAHLSTETSAADEWALSNGSEYQAGGILSGLTGNRAHGIIIDDPIKGRQDADSEIIRNRTWVAYQDDLLTRLIPGGWQVCIQCMIGSTLVSMADGTTKKLQDIVKGDLVSSFSNGRIASAKVLNWANQGSDYCFTITTSSGITVTANERHPFLVERNGRLEWTRLRNITVKDRMVRVTGANGGGSSANRKDAKNQLSAKGFVGRITTKINGRADTAPRLLTPRTKETATSSIDTALPLKNITLNIPHKMDDVRYVDNPQVKTSEHTGAENSVLTTAMIQAKSEGSYAMTVTLLSGMEKQKKCCSELLNTSGFTLDTIVDITPAGYEDVYDIQVEGTENFIANGLVSHNTRWHEDDLAGRILPKDWSGESGDILCRDGETWRVVCIQAQCERADDPVGRQIGEYLWPGWFSEKHFAQFKRVPRTWNALYQQIPASEEGDYFKTEHKQYYEHRPKHLRIYGASDFAVTDGGGDFTEHGVFGLDPNDDLYILDWWYGQTTSDVWIEEELDLIKRHKPVTWYGEGGVIRRAVEPTLIRRSRERRIYCDFQWLNSITDKPTRARGFQARWSMRKVYVPADTDKHPWVPRLLRQLSRFPAGAEDDGVDVCSLIGRALDDIFSASAPSDADKKARNDYAAHDEEDDEDGWKTA